MMSIRLRLTLIYSGILALTLVVFGTVLYTIQARETINTLQASLQQSADGLAQSILSNYLNPNPPPRPQGLSSHSPPSDRSRIGSARASGGEVDALSHWSWSAWRARSW